MEEKNFKTVRQLQNAILGELLSMGLGRDIKLFSLPNFEILIMFHVDSPSLGYIRLKRNISYISRLEVGEITSKVVKEIKKLEKGNY